GRLERLPRTLAVVGAGVIGIEYASMFAALGIEVTVVDKRDRPLEFLDAEIVDELIHQMRKANVYFRFGEAVGHLDVSLGAPGRRAAPCWHSSRGNASSPTWRSSPLAARAPRRRSDSSTPVSPPMSVAASRWMRSSARRCRTSSPRAT